MVEWIGRANADRNCRAYSGIVNSLQDVCIDPNNFATYFEKWQLRIVLGAIL